MTATPMPDRETDVVVIGAGPAGLLLAGDLAELGLRTVLLDRDRDAHHNAPGAALGVAAVELLERRGMLGDDLADAFTAPLPRAHFALIPLDLDRLAARYRRSIVISQSDVERILEQRARRVGATVIRGRDVVGLESAPDEVAVLSRSTDVNGEHPAVTRAKFVVGADGRDSTVRDLVGIAVDSTERPFYGLVGDLEVDIAALAPAHLGAYWCEVGGVYMCLPMGRDTVRLITAEHGREVPDDPAVSIDEVRATVERLTGCALPPTTSRWVGRYRDRTQLARRFRDDGSYGGRVFLAGDAAHTVYPLNGQALATAMQDGAELAWRLVAALRDDAPAGLLDSWERERRAVAESVRSNIAAQVALTGDAAAVAALREMFVRLFRIEAVNLAMADLVLSIGARHDMPGVPEHPLLGTTLAPVVLDAVAGGHPLGRGLLVDFGAGVVAAGWRDRIDTVVSPPLPDIDATALLLRPDGVVGWVATLADSRPDPEAAMTTWFGRPQSDDHIAAERSRSSVSV